MQVSVERKQLERNRTYCNPFTEGQHVVWVDENGTHREAQVVRAYQGYDTDDPILVRCLLRYKVGNKWEQAGTHVSRITLAEGDE
jgi:hypothetical protein